MTAQTAGFIQASSYSAVDLRRYTAAAIGGRSFEALSPATGPIGRGHGVLSADAMEVTATPTPDNEVHVAPGIAAVRGTQADNQGSYLCPLDAEFDITIPAKHASITTNHYVVAQVKDAAYAAHTGDVWTPELVDGSGVRPANPTVPEDCLVLARITVPGGTSPASTIVTGSNITDLRPHARATGGIHPIDVKTNFPNPQNYDVIWEISTSQLLIRLAGVWVTIGRNLDANWTTYTPTFGGVSLGNGSVYGRYQRLGRTVIGVCGFDLGTTGNMPAGGGGLNASLPVTCYNPGSTVRYMGAGRAFIGTAFYSCTAEINPSVNPNIIQQFATAGLAEWNETNPANWGTPGAGNGQLRVMFLYEAA